MDRPEHILLVRLSAVGDILLATPVAAWLRAAYPSARITWLVDAGYIDLVRSNPQIDSAIEFEYTGRHRGPGGIRRLARQLAPVSLLVDLQHKIRTLLLAAYLRPARRRVLVKRRGFGLVRALVGRDAILRAPHQVERYLSVVDEHAGRHESARPVLCVTEEEREAARKIIGDRQSDRPLIGLFPSARHETKRWPVAHVADLADRCVAEGFRVAILGGEQDKLFAQAVLDSMKTPAAVVHSRGSLGQLAGVISLCSAVVGPDSGPIHMAAAAGVPVVALFGPTSPERWAPRARIGRVLRERMPCSPCSNHGSASCPEGTLACMYALRPERVWEALVEILESEGRSDSHAAIQA